MRTLPSGSRIVVWRDRAVISLPVAVNVPGVCAIAIEAWAVNPTKSRKTDSAMRNARGFLTFVFMLPSRMNRVLFTSRARAQGLDRPAIHAGDDLAPEKQGPGNP